MKLRRLLSVCFTDARIILDEYCEEHDVKGDDFYDVPSKTISIRSFNECGLLYFKDLLELEVLEVEPGPEHVIDIIITANTEDKDEIDRLLALYGDFLKCIANPSVEIKSSKLID